MKKYVRNILLFFIAVALLDLLFGMACQYMNEHSRGGGVKSRYYVCKESNEDVLIFGSSRAKHHYVPGIIEDSLGMSCYNTGEDGNGIIYCYGVLKMITQRYTPKLIIYDVSVFDISIDDNAKYLDLLKAYYHEPGIDSIFWTVEPKTRLMMLSHLYRYNTTCLRMFGNYVHPITNTPKGYGPLFGTMDYEPEIKRNKKETVLDSLKYQFFEKFIRLTQDKHISLICCVSPSYKGDSSDIHYNSIKDLCKKYDVPFLFQEANSDISYNKLFFQNRTHLNDEGARLYTRIIANQILNIHSTY